MKTLYKRIALTLIFVLGAINISPTIQAYANTTSDNSSEIFIFDEQNNISIPNLNLSEQEIRLANEYIQDQLDNGAIIMMPRSAAVLAGSFFIPGVGQAVITAAGVIIVGGAVVSAGSWLGKKVLNWVQTNTANQINAVKNSIPSNLKKKNGNVDLGKFKDKNGRTPLNKNSGTFKNGRWSVEKDTAGHGGRKWKLKKDGTRVGSLDGNGKVISK
ncbi:hypothetical protein [Clostridium perfringens]|uniref:hypothetical protein n=1 Tax=Clostridium perfringens TaxID=1502 RepID=UPI002444C91B|nr:hypothetical protein [Clostridium perfringens]MDG6893993.1 hypothetical protein [Clostridium perfringens]